MSDPDRIAPAGTIWFCGACGKTARDRYGIEGEHSRGWDESCMLNAILCVEASAVLDATGRPARPACPVKEQDHV